MRGRERKGVEGEGETSGPIRMQLQTIFDVKEVDVKLDHGVTALIHVTHVDVVKQLARRPVCAFFTKKIRFLVHLL